MLSFYFTVGASEHGELLEVPPGRTHPARVAIAVCNHSNPEVRRRWLELVDNLARLNPTVLQAVVERLEGLEMGSEIPGAGATRRAILQVLQSAGSTAREGTL